MTYKQLRKLRKQRLNEDVNDDNWYLTEQEAENFFEELKYIQSLVKEHLALVRRGDYDGANTMLRIVRDNLKIAGDNLFRLTPQDINKY